MLENFYTDLQEGKDAELIALEILADQTTRYNFTWVGDLKECRYKGDILATAADGTEHYIEIKNDKDIATTGNILCEDENYIKETGRFIKGNMWNDTDYFAVLSQADRKLYILDYKVLQSIYRKGEFKVIPHRDQDTYCYLLDLARAKQWGALIYTLNY